MARCAHQLGVNSPRLRLLVLDTMGAALDVLRNAEDHLLPAINTLWPALVALLGTLRSLAHPCIS